MNDAVTCKDVMSRSYVGVNEADPVAGVARLMWEEGVDSVVVVRGSAAVGLLGATNVVGVVANGEDPAETLVGDVMTDDFAVVRVNDPLSDVVAALSESETGHAVVVDNEGVAGLVTGLDIVTTHAIFGPDEHSDVERFEEEPVEANPAEEATVDFSEQGVCGECGSLARDLREFNGELVCPDCAQV